MGNRTLAFDGPKSIIKTERIIRAFVSIAEGGTTPVLQKYNYGAFNTGSVANTFTAAPTTGGATTPFNKYAQGEAGVFSVARTATGLWTLTLQDPWHRLLYVRGHVRVAGGSTNIVSINENSTITNINAANQGIVGISLMSATATLADPTGPCIVCLKIEVSDATED